MITLQYHCFTENTGDNYSRNICYEIASLEIKIVLLSTALLYAQSSTVPLYAQSSTVP